MLESSTGDLLATIENPTSAIDSFGQSVAVSGNIVVVGAPLVDHSGMTDAGEAYVFNTQGEFLTSIQWNAQNGAGFGQSVAVWGTPWWSGRQVLTTTGLRIPGRPTFLTRRAHTWPRFGSPCRTMPGSVGRWPSRGTPWWSGAWY